MSDSENIDEPYAASFAFADPVGPWLPFYAWRPRRLYDGRWIWLRRGWKQIMVVPLYLQPGGGHSFWRYTDHTLSQARRASLGRWVDLHAGQ